MTYASLKSRILREGKMLFTLKSRGSALRIARGERAYDCVVRS